MNMIDDVVEPFAGEILRSTGPIGTDLEDLLGSMQILGTKAKTLYKCGIFCGLAGCPRMEGCPVMRRIESGNQLGILQYLVYLVQ